jgi:hypothetical protein
MQPVLLGQLLVNFGIVTEAQLKSALETQRRGVPRKRLGDLLVGQSVVDENSLRGILSVQKRKLDAAQAAVSTQETMAQRLAGRPLAEILLVARELAASDLHITSGRPPLVRIEGVLRELEVPALSDDRCRQLPLDASPAERRQFEAQHSPTPRSPTRAPAASASTSSSTAASTAARSPACCARS